MALIAILVMRGFLLVRLLGCSICMRVYGSVIKLSFGGGSCIHIVERGSCT